MKFVIYGLVPALLPPNGHWESVNPDKAARTREIAR
jgi:hypothetical protein